MTLPERFHRARRDPDLAVLEGFHALKHALRFSAHVCEIVVATGGSTLQLCHEFAPELLPHLKTAPTVTEEQFARLAPLPHPTGVIAIARRRSARAADALQAPGTQPLVLLEAPAHLGNLGAAVRVAAAAGAGGVLVTGVHDPWHPEALRAAAGLHFALPVAHLTALPSCDRPLVAVTPGGEPLGVTKIPERAILAFGTERSGLSAHLLEVADTQISIPMTTGVSSLNLATAVAVVLYQAALK